MHELDVALSPEEVLQRHGDTVKQLVLANRTLFAGVWDDFAEDLRRRKAGRPYLFRLPFDPDEALLWIHRLQVYERARAESLGDALAVEEDPG